MRNIFPNYVCFSESPNFTCSKCSFPLFNKKYAIKYPTLIWRIYFQDSASEGEGAGDEIPDIEEKEDGGSGNEFEEDDFIVDAEG